MNDSTALTVLDGRFPVAVTQPPVLFDQLTREWDDRKTTSRAIARGARRDACTEITYINAHPRRRGGDPQRYIRNSPKPP